MLLKVCVLLQESLRALSYAAAAWQCSQAGNQLQGIDAKTNLETDDFPIKIASGSYLIYFMHFGMCPALKNCAIFEQGVRKCKRTINVKSVLSIESYYVKTFISLLQ